MSAACATPATSKPASIVVPSKIFVIDNPLFWSGWLTRLRDCRSTSSALKYNMQRKILSHVCHIIQKTYALNSEMLNGIIWLIWIVILPQSLIWTPQNGLPAGYLLLIFSIAYKKNLRV